MLSYNNRYNFKQEVYVGKRCLFIVFLLFNLRKINVFFRLHQNAFFRYTYFNCLLAVGEQAIIQLAKNSGAEDMKYFICFGPSSMALLVLKQEEIEVESLLGINIPYRS